MKFDIVCAVTVLLLIVFIDPICNWLDQFGIYGAIFPLVGCVLFVAYAIWEARVKEG